MTKKGDRRRSQGIRQAKHERRESARKERQAERKQQLGHPPNVKFTSVFGPDILAGCGPQLFCEWEIPAATADAMRKAGRAVPSPISGAILLDTGATRTCIALKTAIDLGLQPTRM